MPHPPGATVRAATDDDLPSIRRVAATVGEDHEWGGGDDSYVRHLMATGRVVVADRNGVVGYAAARASDAGRGRVSMLCDLFVDPAVHGTGCGRALLDELWRDEPRRMTFSSLHPHALPLYTAFGLSAWWPLLYLDGAPTRRMGSADLSVRTTDPREAAALDRSWTAEDRAADWAAWASRPDGVLLAVARGAEPVAVAAAGGADAALAVERVAVARSLPPADVADVVIAAIGAFAADRPVGVRIPAPHPATRSLLAAGWRVTTYDLLMATEPDLVDPARCLPSPSLA